MARGGGSLWNAMRNHGGGFGGCSFGVMKARTVVLTGGAEKIEIQIIFFFFF